MTRREFLRLPALFLPQQEDNTTLAVFRLQKAVLELEAGLKNQGEASFMRDQALLRLIDPSMGITYYGQILEDLARGE